MFISEALARDGTFITYVEIPAWFVWLVYGLPIVAIIVGAILIFYYVGRLAEWWLGRLPFSQPKEK